MPSVFAWKVLGTYIITAHNPEIYTGGGQEARGGPCGSQEPAEDARDGDPKGKPWAEEKAALMTRTEQAEKALSEKTTELSGLKRQVSQMVAAIFGKSPHRLSSSLYMS